MHSDSKKALIEDINSQLTGDSPQATQQQKTVLAHLMNRLPGSEAGLHSSAQWRAVVVNLTAFMQQRLPGQVKIRVFNPNLETHGWESARTVIEIVNDDMPFLVDCIGMALDEMEIAFQRIIHPVIRVERDPGGNILDIHDVDEHERGDAESVMHVLIDRLSDQKQVDALISRIEAGLEDARCAVRDWRQMREQCEQLAEVIVGDNVPYDGDVRKDAAEFLRWLADDHFTFLGYREYRVKTKRGHPHLEAVAESGLGLLSKASPNPSRRIAPLSEWGPESPWAPEPVIVTKSNARSTVHRAGYMDYIGIIRHDEDGNVVGESRMLGLFTSSAYNCRSWNIPLVRQRVNDVMERSGLDAAGHGGKALLHILETLPRDELFQATGGELFDFSMGILNLQERRSTRLFVRRDRFGRFFSCLVFIPRELFNTEARTKIQRILTRALKGEHLDFNVQISESVLARLHVVIRTKLDQEVEYDVELIEQKIAEAVRSWSDQLRQVLVERFGEEQGLAWYAQYGAAFPAAYVEEVSPWVASFDVNNVAHLASPDGLRMSLYRPRKRHVGVYRFKVFRCGSTIPLSDVLPMLENMGVRVVSERPYKLRPTEGEVSWIQDFDIVFPRESELELEAIREPFQVAFEKVLCGDAENDGFNRLILVAGLDWRQVAMLRAYCKYLLQIGVPFSQSYMEGALCSHPVIVRLLVELFEARFDPVRDQWTDAQAQSFAKSLARTLNTSLSNSEGGIKRLLTNAANSAAKSREVHIDSLRTAVRRLLDGVTSLDEDRILRVFGSVMMATLRTNFYQQPGEDQWHEYMCFKFDSESLSELPKPRPKREVFVYSPRVEGVHLRMGLVARGGLRWSDRREDFRTEVLGLMKAQNVKNTMIVPVGAKGGFYVKKLPENESRDVVMAEVVHCYRSFINGLLDITDNLSPEGEIVHPSGVVRYDGDDPYMVVAADKGTATFSDIANSVSAQHGFWLGDAFASGGSVGYDHKGMGITAKGAWESVKRHFFELGLNTQTTDFTVVGIGDMSGDVFGNGMLLSPHIRLKAAFNHMHVFIDPEPDAARSFAERQRLFDLPRSSWTDYDQSLISEGGGIYERSAKTIPLSPEVKSWLGVTEDELTPSALIKELITAPVDLLWNGGIGTYVKAESETDQSVGDRANNSVRVNGKDLRCKVIGEGGNLGMTQSGRIEFALRGGRVNTDFIDNSAGVDCSDHEVNIKILLGLALREGELDEAQRNNLLAEMTDEVSDLVLRNNFLQNQALSVMERFSSERIGAKGHLISVLEARGILDRELENLPDDAEILRRRKKGQGLTRPELSTLLSYSKISLYSELIDSDIPDDPYLSTELHRYFPTPLQKKFQALMEKHQLRREIIITVVTNSVVNRMGATFVLRMQEDTGASSAQIAKAYSAAREIFDARALWARLESVEHKVPAQSQVDAYHVVWRLLRQATRWLLVRRGGALNIAKLVAEFHKGIGDMVDLLDEVASSKQRRSLKREIEDYEQLGFDRETASDLARLPLLQPALDVVEIANQESVSVERSARVHFRLGKVLHLKWLSACIESLPVSGQWHAHARGGLRDQMYGHYRDLTAQVLRFGDDEDVVDQWQSKNQQKMAHYNSMLTDMRSGQEMDYATVSVALRALDQLVRNTRR